jgi:periplasmic divalent cation tolerance protein
MGEKPAVLAVLTTTDSAERADSLASSVVRRGLAACAQISAPITSYYRWQGEVQRDQEWQVLLKTTATRYADLEAYIKAAHDYAEPEIIAFPVVRGSAGYLAWVAAESSPDTEL